MIKGQRGWERYFRSLPLRDLDRARLHYQSSPEVEAIRAKVRAERACRCGQTLYTPRVHAFCLNCAGHNPVCAGRHCDRHPYMLATGEWNGRALCPVDA